MARTLQVAPRATRKPRTTKTAPTLEQIQARAYEIYLERRGALAVRSKTGFALSANWFLTVWPRPASPAVRQNPKLPEVR